jgi:hypothetical protein
LGQVSAEIADDIRAPEVDGQHPEGALMLAPWARQSDDDALAVVSEKLTRCAWHSRTVVGARTACNDARRAAVLALAQADSSARRIPARRGDQGHAETGETGNRETGQARRRGQLGNAETGQARRAETRATPTLGDQGPARIGYADAWEPARRRPETRATPRPGRRTARLRGRMENPGDR